MDTVDKSSARTIQPATFLFLLARVQIVVVVAVALILFDVLIPDTSREVLRHALLDESGGFPYAQLVYAGISLLLMCLAIRFTTEAMFALVADDVFHGTGPAATFASTLPRVLSIVAGVAAGVPLLSIGLVSLLGTSSALDSGQAQVAILAGLVFLLIGLVCAWAGKGLRVVPTDTPEGGALSRMVLRLSLLMTPVVILGVLVWAVLGPLSASSFAAGWLERYSGGGLGTFLLDVFVIGFSALSIRLTLQILLGLIFPGDERSPTALGRLLWIVARAVPLAIAAMVIYQVVNSPIPEGNLGERLPVPAWLALFGVAGAFAVAALYGTFGTRLHIYQRIAEGWTVGIDRFSRFRPVWHSLFALLMLLGLATFALFYGPMVTTDMSLPTRLGALSIVFLWGFAFVVFFFPIAFLAHITRLPILASLFAVACVFSALDLNDNHELRVADNVPADALSTIKQLSLKEWLKTRNDLAQYDNYPVFVIATEGGGIRAAYFTASLLGALQDVCPSFAQHTIAISGVSGGSVGMAAFGAYTADIKANDVPNTGCADAIGKATQLARTRMRRAMDADLLSPLLGAFLFPDALQRILPVPVPAFDRVRALEYTFEQSWRRACHEQSAEPCDGDRLARSVADLYGSSDVPYLFFNVTEVESGRIVPLSSARLGKPPAPHADGACVGADVTSGSGQVLQDILARSIGRVDGGNPPLSTAAVLSARFPYVTPAGRIEIAQDYHGAKCVRRYVDGGYFENSGSWLVATVVGSFLREIATAENEIKKAKEKIDGAQMVVEEAVRNVANVRLYPVIVRSTPCTRDTVDEPCAEDGNDVGSAGWNELMSPARTLLKTREARAQYSRDGLVGDLDRAKRYWTRLFSNEASGGVGAGCDPVFPVCLVELQFKNTPGVEIPLSWVLSSAAQGAMDSSIDHAVGRALAGPSPEETSDVIAPGSDGDVKGALSTIVAALKNRKPGGGEAKQ